MSIEAPLVIAIDGPAASGKGTVARMIAEHFDLDYLDTGSIYRAVAWQIMKRDLDPSNVAEVVRVAQSITYNNVDSENLTNEGVGHVASIISAIPQVRQELIAFQRNVAQSPQGSVLDGRDIGSVICPEADFKFYLSADLDARAKRRYKQLQNKGNSIIYQSVLENLRKRDDRDSNRTIAPLTKADDAIHIDTTNMDASEVFDKILSIISDAQVNNSVAG